MWSSSSIKSEFKFLNTLTSNKSDYPQKDTTYTSQNLYSQVQNAPNGKIVKKSAAIQTELDRRTLAFPRVNLVGALESGALNSSSRLTSTQIQTFTK
jgi:hypothetical protein